LFDALYELSKHSAKTKMDVPNLAMVFSPCLIRCPATDPLVVMECLPKEGMFVNRLLKDYIYMRTLQDNPEFAEAEHKRLVKEAEARMGGLVVSAPEDMSYQEENEGEPGEMH